MEKDQTIVQTWDVAKFDIKPGEILILRWNRGDWILSPREVEQVLQAGQQHFRKALDSLGLTSDKVPILPMTSDWDLLVMSPLDLLDACATAAKNERDNDDGA